MGLMVSVDKLTSSRVMVQSSPDSARTVVLYKRYEVLQYFFSQFGRNSFFWLELTSECKKDKKTDKKCRDPSPRPHTKATCCCWHFPSDQKLQPHIIVCRPSTSTRCHSRGRIFKLYIQDTTIRPNLFQPSVVTR